jgi:NNP family nitrate/nitrite transporter-like MFS transporter
VNDVTTSVVSKPGLSRERIAALSMSTLAFAVNFAVWVMFSVIGIKIKAELHLNETEFGLLVATPVLTGSLVRLPLGMLTDRYGGRIVYFLQMLTVVIPTWVLSYATEYWQYLVLGLFIGMAGGSFAVGIAYTSAWFSKERQGTAMGIFGAGNAGSSLGPSFEFMDSTGFTCLSCPYPAIRASVAPVLDEQAPCNGL